MSSKVIIKEAVLARPTGHRDSGYTMKDEKVVGKLIIEFENVKTETCVIDEERGKAISVETRQVYDFVRRDPVGRIASHEIEKIKSNEIIALRLMDKNWDKISMLYQLSLKERAKEVFKSYIESISQEEKGKSFCKGAFVYFLLFIVCFCFAKFFFQFVEFSFD